MLDTKQYLATIGSFASGVTVIVAESNGSPHGMTATAVISVSLSPMLLAVSVSKKARMAEALTAGARFSINILREEQAHLSNHFAGAIKTHDRASEVRFVNWEGGARLDGCLAALGCEVADECEGGDHWLVIGKVLHVYNGPEPGKPLLYFRGRYGTLQTGGALAPERADFDQGTPQIYYDW